MSSNSKLGRRRRAVGRQPRRQEMSADIYFVSPWMSLNISNVVSQLSLRLLDDIHNDRKCLQIFCVIGNVVMLLNDGGELLGRHLHN